eukprot:PRCOL_00006464-RA
MALVPHGGADGSPRGGVAGGAGRRARPDGLAAWRLYFPGEERDDGDRRARLVAELAAALRASPAMLAAARRSARAANAFAVSYKRLLECSGSADLQAALEFQPVEGLCCVGAAAYEAVYCAESASEDTPPAAAPRVRLTEYVHSPVNSIAALRANCVGRLVSVRGTVVRASAVRPLVTMLEFKCEKCGEVSAVPMPDGVFNPPTKCGVNGCRSGRLVPRRKTARLVDWQRVRLQEQTSFGAAADGAAAGSDRRGRRDSGGGHLEQALDGEGRVPQNVEVDLREDLAGRASPGDEVTVVGLVKAVDADEAARNGGASGGFGGGKARSTVYVIFLEAVSLVKCPRRGGLDAGGGTDDRDGAGQSQEALEGPGGGGAAGDAKEKGEGRAPTFSRRELNMVATVAREVADPLRLLVNSLCPDIYGHEMAKCGLILALLGGVRLYDTDTRAAAGSGSSGAGVALDAPTQGRVPVRGDIHCLLLGDPGLGKSQLLRAVTAVSPRGVYVGGGHSSAAGLTASVARDGGAGTMFEAGALVMADGGTCCIDELDKLTTSYGNLLEAMEQQSVSLAKAGLVSTLQARTTVVAAANPAKGHYDRTRTVAENIRMPAPLLSRFDLIFVLLDRADAGRDEMLTRHVMSMHGVRDGSRALLLEGPGERVQTAAGARGGLLDSLERSEACSEGGGGGMGLGSGGGALAARLRQRRGDDPDPLPPHLLKTYIAYARQHCHPQLDGEACSKLKEFYLKLRRQAAGKGAAGAPITARQLESLARLTQARARVDLRNVATGADAEDAISVMRASLRDVLEDEAGMIDLRRAGGMSKQVRVGDAVRSIASRAPRPRTRPSMRALSDQWACAVVVIYAARPALTARVDARTRAHPWICACMRALQAEAKRLVSELQRLVTAEGRVMLTVDEIRAAANAVRVADADAAVESLNAAGVLLKKGHRLYSLAASLCGRGSGML